MKSSNIGGQAVIEGVMMRSGDQYAVAVRKPNGEIEVQKKEWNSFARFGVLTKIPFIRGVFNFIDSMVLGMKTLTYSASFYEDEEEENSKGEDFVNRVFKEKAESVVIGFAVVMAVVLAVAVFMVLPYYLSEFVRKFTNSYTVQAAFEGVIRLVIFIGYVLLISRMKEIHRVYCYHGAEHKCINCIEHGLELNVENVMKSSKQHKRCGTSFLLFVMIVSIIVCMLIRVDSSLLRLVYRILLFPLIAGISYEIIRLAGRSTNPIVCIVSKPGMWLQNLTTKEPDEAMAEVAIASVEAVFDWRKYLEENREE